MRRDGKRVETRRDQLKCVGHKGTYFDPATHKITLTHPPPDKYSPYPTATDDAARQAARSLIFPQAHFFALILLCSCMQIFQGFSIFSIYQAVQLEGVYT
jgi:hypothetical protein